MQHIFAKERSGRSKKNVTFVKDFMLKRFSSIILYLGRYVFCERLKYDMPSICIFLYTFALHIYLNSCRYDFLSVLDLKNSSVTVMTSHERIHDSYPSFHLNITPLSPCHQFCRRSTLICLTGVVCMTDSMNVSVIPQSINQSKISY